MINSFNNLTSSTWKSVSEDFPEKMKNLARVGGLDTLNIPSINLIALIESPPSQLINHSQNEFHHHKHTEFPRTFPQSWMNERMNVFEKQFEQNLIKVGAKEKQRKWKSIHMRRNFPTNKRMFYELQARQQK